MTILVAQITPMAPAGCTTCYAGVIDLNNAIPAWAADITTANSPVSIVDAWTGYNTTLDTGDGVHPNDAGNVILANDWFAPLSSAILKVGGGSATTTVVVGTSTKSVSVATSTKASTSVKATSTSKIVSTTLVPSATKTTSITKTASGTTSASTATQTMYGQCGEHCLGGEWKRRRSMLIVR